MELQGTQEFQADRTVIWDTVFRPEVLEECIPGAKSVEQPSENTYEAEVVRGLASITVTMDLFVEIEEDYRPEGVVCEIEGKDNRINSTVNGEATVEIEENDDGSLLEYEATLSFTGKLASIGARLIKRQVTKDLNQLFSSLEEYIADQQQVESVE